MCSLRVLSRAEQIQAVHTHSKPIPPGTQFNFDQIRQCSRPILNTCVFGMVQQVFPVSSSSQLIPRGYRYTNLMGILLQRSQILKKFPLCNQIYIPAQKNHNKYGKFSIIGYKQEFYYEFSGFNTLIFAQSFQSLLLSLQYAQNFIDMSMLPQIKNYRNKNSSTLRIFQENPQSSTYTENLLEPVTQQKSLYPQKKRYSAPKSYEQMIKETEDILNQLQQQESPTPIKSIKPNKMTHRRYGTSLQRNHKLIFEHQINMKPKNKKKQIIYGDNISTVSKVIGRKVRTRTEADHNQNYSIMLPKRKTKYLNLEEELENLRKLMMRDKADIFQKKKSDTIFIGGGKTKELHKDVEVEKNKFTKREKVEAMLACETIYFRKLKDDIWNENTSALIEKYGIEKESNKKQEVEYTIRFPKLSEIQKLIAGYAPLTDYINIDLLIREGRRYFREYRDDDEKEYLYFGEHNDNKERHGKGVLVTPYRILQGMWDRGDIKEGVQLQRKFKYKGRFNKNKKHGRGQFESVGGEKYKGEWVNNKRHGHGEWLSENGQSYVGDWVQGKAEGYGVYISKEGDRYEGQFRGYLKCGLGKEYFANGDYFQGEFIQGFPHGKGKYIWKNQLKFEGRFVNGIRQGYGRLTKQGLFEFNGRFQKEKPKVTEQSVVYQDRNYRRSLLRTQHSSISIPINTISQQTDSNVARMQIPYTEEQSFYETEDQNCIFTQFQN